MIDIYNTNYSETINKAVHGDPSAMFELAMLYNCNAISSSSDEEYIHWLKEFLKSKQIQQIVEALDDDGETNYNDYPDFFESYHYYPMIIEAGIALGLYYKNSSNIEDVIFARNAFYDAFVVSRFNYIEITEGESLTDIVSLLAQTEDRLSFLSGGDSL